MNTYNPAKQKAEAVTLMLLSSLSFAAMGAFVKLSGPIPVFEKAFFRNLVSLIIAVILLAKQGQSPWGSPQNRLALLGRGIFGTIGVIFYFYAIDRLILADSGMLNKMHPFFVSVFAFFFLKEKISINQMAALLIALLGSALIIKPGFDFGQTFPAVICFLSALFAGLAYVFVSYLGGKENSYTIVFWFSMISSLITLPPAVAGFVMPSPLQFIYLIAAGFAAAGGQFSLTVAYRLAPAGEISIYNYTNVIFSSLIGMAVFSEIPDRYSAAGYALITAAGYLIFRFGRIKPLSND